ncbi:MAG: VWA domain-containing protein, partial [Acidimicrobiales bacterium]|nr:VWA domain-containing protein [Acidimicrobiales bacterium]
MTFINPLGLLLGLLAIPVLLLHILKPRREEIEVSSTYLWRDHAAPVSSAAPWQKLKPSVLLLLQLLAVALLALAVARPAWVAPVPLADHTVFMLDTSGSMAAADGTDDILPDNLDATRLAQAKRIAEDLRAELPENGLASIIVAGPRPRVLLTASPDAVEFAESLDRVPNPGGEADFGSAFTLAESLETPGTP